MKFVLMIFLAMFGFYGIRGAEYTTLGCINVDDVLPRIKTKLIGGITAKLVNLKPLEGLITGDIVFKCNDDFHFNENYLLALTFSTAVESEIKVRMSFKWYIKNSLRRDWNTFEISGQGQQTVMVPFPFDMKTKPNRINFKLKMNKECELKEVTVVAPDLNIRHEGDPLQALKTLVLKGEIAKNGLGVQVCLKDADGKLHRKSVEFTDSGFKLEWENPPLTVGKWNTVYAETEIDGKTIASLPVAVFGYKMNMDYAWLRVKGKNIVTSPKSKGGERIFIATGIGYAKDVIMSADDEDVVKFCKSQHLNTIRMPFYTNLFNNESGKNIDIDEHIKFFIDPIVKAAKRHDMYVILDAHEYFHQNIDESRARGEQADMSTWSEGKIQKWITNWTKVAEYYKNEPNILAYELLNEPHSLPPEFVRNLYRRCLKEIRKVDQKHIVILGNNDWSHARAMEQTWGEFAIKIDEPYNNVAFAFHDYPEDDNPWIVQKHVVAFRDKYNVPVICTEFGATHWSKSETVCREFMTGMFTLFAQENISWMIWALKKLENNPRSPYNKIDKTGLGPPPVYDSCPYSDMWPVVARMMGSKFPQNAEK